MSNTIGTKPTTNEIRTWFGLKHVTITFTTESGSRYTVVRRPKIAVLVNDETGQVWSGDHLFAISDRVRLWNGANPVWETSPVTHFCVLSN